MLKRPAIWWHISVVLLMIWGLFSAVNGILAIVHEAPIPVGSTEKVIVQPREPGTAYDVVKFLNRADTKVTLGVPLEVRGIHYVASSGQEQIDWKDTEPRGSNPNAIHYWIDQNGKQQWEPVEITNTAAELFRKKLNK